MRASMHSLLWPVSHTEKEHESDLEDRKNNAGSSENIIELKNLRKVYRIGEEKVVALDDVSLT